MESIRKAMNERNLNEGQWEDRKQWILGVGQRRKTFRNRYIYIYIYIYIYNKTRFCSSSWLITKIILSCTVSKIFFFFYFPNDRYIECLSLTYATNKYKTLKSQYGY